MLWFAFNSVYLNYREQRFGWEYTSHMVVICFQFSIFELPGTTEHLQRNSAEELWFAFNSVYLNYREQPPRAAEDVAPRCDLLSIQYIWTTGNNRYRYKDVCPAVVICFQFSIFELPGTTFSEVLQTSSSLWFAFNSVYLNYREQRFV